LRVGELIAPERLRHFRFRQSSGFAAEELGEDEAPGGTVCETPRWRLSAAILEHHGPSLGYALEEPRRINVWKNRLEARGLQPGSWLKTLKQAVRKGMPDYTDIPLPDGSRVPLGTLRETPRWRLSAAILEHHGPSLGYALEEPRRINVWKNRLEARGLQPGSWLKTLKQAVRKGMPDYTDIPLPDGSRVPLGSLR